MEGKNTGEGQRWKTIECFNAASLGRSEDTQTSGFMRDALPTAASEPSFYTSFLAEQTFAAPGVQLCNMSLLQRCSWDNCCQALLLTKSAHLAGCDRWIKVTARTAF